MPAERGTILVVDDCEPLRQVLCRFLERRGFRCVEAGGADEAERLFGDGAGFEGVVTDLDMPGGPDGIELIARLKRRAPSVPSVLVSADLPHGLDPASIGAAAALRKDNDVRALAAAIERALGA